VADNLLDLAPHVLPRDAHRLQRLGGDALALEEQPKQQVLGADVVVAEQPGLLLSQVNGPPGPVGEPAEHALGLGPHRRPLEPLSEQQRRTSSHRCLLRAGPGTAGRPQPGRQPVGGVPDVERAGRQLRDHGCDRPGRVGVQLPAVQTQELQHGRQRDLLVAAPQWPLPHQRVQQDGGQAGRVAGPAARPDQGQGTLGSRGVEQVEHLAGVQAERAAGDHDQVSDL